MTKPEAQKSENSYGQILRSSSIIGGASVLNILIGLLKTKAAALLLGPAGVGLIGLLQSLMGTASTIAALGFGNVGTRQIAEAAGAGQREAIVVARRALFWGTLGLSLLGGLIFWLLRGTLAREVLRQPELAPLVGWLALGVTLSVAAGSQTALLNGLRRIGDIARVNVSSALLSTLVGLAALVLWGEQGIFLFILSAPLASFLLGHWFVSRLPRVEAAQARWRQLLQQWQTLVQLGVSFMLAGLAVTVGQLVVRTLIQRELGAEALGHFQAAWMISMTYLGFVLQAMGTDYYPRLTASIRDAEATNRLVNEQTEVALLLAGPVFLLMLGLAPWVIQLLYSSQFQEAAHVLRWQVFGDILKVASWPLGFVILAAGAGRTFVFTESLAISIFVALTWWGLPVWGVEMTGLAFVGMYALYLPAVFFLAKKRTQFSWQRGVLRQLSLVLLLAALTAASGRYSDWLGAMVGVSSALLLGWIGLLRLGQMVDPESRLGRILGRVTGTKGKEVKDK